MTKKKNKPVKSACSPRLQSAPHLIKKRADPLSFLYALFQLFK
ncbi:hypothetical protein CHCC14821_1270 [Bacillus paralicheniformis]|nr:hypothetical protein CHCC14821_1270 [Bacillus paralicheniformis]